MIRTNEALFTYVTRLFRSVATHKIDEQHFAPGQKILTEGKNVYAVYILKSGIVKSYLTTDTGNTFIQEFFGEGELFGELELMDETPAFCTVEAIDAVSVYKISKSDFLVMLDEDQKLNKLFMRGLVSKLKYKATRHSYNQSHTIEDKLSRLKMKLPALEQVISKQDIADYLGITLRALNRSIRNLAAISQVGSDK